jgi:hypothetical protein
MPYLIDSDVLIDISRGNRLRASLGDQRPMLA